MNMYRFLCFKRYFKGFAPMRQFLILLFLAACAGTTTFSDKPGRSRHFIKRRQCGGCCGSNDFKRNGCYAVSRQSFRRRCLSNL